MPWHATSPPRPPCRSSFCLTLNDIGIPTVEPMPCASSNPSSYRWAFFCWLRSVVALLPGHTLACPAFSHLLASAMGQHQAVMLPSSYSSFFLLQATIQCNLLFQESASYQIGGWLQDRLSHSWETIGAARHIFLTLCQPISSVTAYEVSVSFHKASVYDPIL